MQVTHDDILAISRLVHDLCGLTLDASKSYLIDSRLSGIAQAAGCASFANLARKAGSGDKSLQNTIIDAITTQETLFFRDGSPYEALEHKVLPELIDRRAASVNPRRLRIWSAGCSTGQEPYSIAMILCNLIPNIFAWDVNILGTDISNNAIRHASIGRYAKYEIQRGMKPHFLTKHFHEEGQCWRVNDELRTLVSFSHRNLLQPFIGLGPFDVIFCRNVAIYFDAETRRDIFRRLAACLTTDGVLFVGSSECLIDVGPEFVPLPHCRTTYYMPRMPKASARPLGMPTPVMPCPTKPATFQSIPPIPPIPAFSGTSVR